MAYTRAVPRRVEYAWSLALLCTLALHGFALAHAGQPRDVLHLLWSCHVATLMLAISLAMRWPLGVASGFLFHLSIGLPAWFAEIIVTRATFGAPRVNVLTLTTSICVHLL